MENVSDLVLEFWHGVFFRETEKVMVDPLAAENDGKTKTTTRSSPSKCPLVRPPSIIRSIEKKGQHLYPNGDATMSITTI